MPHAVQIRQTDDRMSKTAVTSPELAPPVGSFPQGLMTRGE